MVVFTVATHAPRRLRNSCSQNRSTRKPLASSCSIVARSRSRFRSILAAQNDLFVRGTWPQSRQPCQKHPSTKIAKRASGNRKSGLPLSPLGLTFQPRTPRRTKANLSRLSVVLFPRPFTEAIALERVGDTLSNAPPGRCLRRARSILKSLHHRGQTWRSRTIPVVVADLVPDPGRKAVPCRLPKSFQRDMGQTTLPVAPRHDEHPLWIVVAAISSPMGPHEEDCTHGQSAGGRRGCREGDPSCRSAAVRRAGRRTQNLPDGQNASGCGQI